MKKIETTPPASAKSEEVKPLESLMAPAKIRAKFKVASKLEQDAGEGAKQTTITLLPVYGSQVQDPVTFEWKPADDENSQFWKNTPCGKIELACLNQVAADGFITGAEYYVDFIKAEPAQ